MAQCLQYQYQKQSKISSTSLRQMSLWNQEAKKQQYTASPCQQPNSISILQSDNKENNMKAVRRQSCLLTIQNNEVSQHLNENTPKFKIKQLNYTFQQSSFGNNSSCFQQKAMNHVYDVLKNCCCHRQKVTENQQTFRYNVFQQRNSFQKCIFAKLQKIKLVMLQVQMINKLLHKKLQQNNKTQMMFLQNCQNMVKCLALDNNLFQQKIKKLESQNIKLRSQKQDLFQKLSVLQVEIKGMTTKHLMLLNLQNQKSNKTITSSLNLNNIRLSKLQGIQKTSTIRQVDNSYASNRDTASVSSQCYQYQQYKLYAKNSYSKQFFEARGPKLTDHESTDKNNMELRNRLLCLKQKIQGKFISESV